MFGSLWGNLVIQGGLSVRRMEKREIAICLLSQTLRVELPDMKINLFQMVLNQNERAWKQV